ncbi:hypothetical protein AX14_008692, partial [Amanita brunnescens Koide BX004]
MGWAVFAEKAGLLRCEPPHSPYVVPPSFHLGTLKTELAEEQVVEHWQNAWGHVLPLSWGIVHLQLFLLMVRRLAATGMGGSSSILALRDDMARVDGLSVGCVGDAGIIGSK